MNTKPCHLRETCARWVERDTGRVRQATFRRGLLPCCAHEPIRARVDQLAKLFGAPSADVAGLLMEDGLRRAERREARKKAHKNRITPHNSGVDG